MTEQGSQNQDENCLPSICMYCKKRQNDEGAWGAPSLRNKLMPDYMLKQGICPECLRIYYPCVYLSQCDNGEIDILTIPK